MGGEGARFALLSRETNSLQLLREQDGVTELWAAPTPEPGDRAAVRLHTPRKGGHVGTPSLPRSLARGQLPFPFLRYWCVSWVSSPREPPGIFLSSSVAPLHCASQPYLQIQDRLAPPGAARSVPASVRESAVFCARRSAPRPLPHPLGLDSVLRCPRLVSPSPQLQPSRLAPILQRSLPLGLSSGSAPILGAAS